MEPIVFASFVQNIILFSLSYDPLFYFPGSESLLFVPSVYSNPLVPSNVLEICCHYSHHFRNVRYYVCLRNTKGKPKKHNWPKAFVKLHFVKLHLNYFFLYPKQFAPRIFQKLWRKLNLWRHSFPNSRRIWLEKPDGFEILQEFFKK